MIFLEFKNDEESEALGGCVSPGPRLELSFEYLMSKDR